MIVRSIRARASRAAIALLCGLLGLSACSELSATGSPTSTSTSLSVPASVLAETSGTPPARLFLQQVTSSSAIIKWRGPAAEACLYAAAGGKIRCQAALETASEHREVRFVGLSADRQYGYSVGTYRGPELRFRTAPRSGQLPADGTLRLWLLGDSGTASVRNGAGLPKYPGKAQAVMEGFLAYNRDRSDDPLDMILLLGDNAYPAGTDREWQLALFDLYGPLLYQSSLWPTIGNHEMGYGEIDYPGYGRVTWSGVSTSASADSFWTPQQRAPQRMPYLDIFTLPAAAEAGGVASGTEQYYAFDYGNVHVVSLDSQLSARDASQREAMRQWLVADLAANELDWTIVIFHHPPYTKGSHDSDTEATRRVGYDQPILDMRREFTPVFEDYGVDLVYSGHSHSYERSWYLHGHRGDADSFRPELHAELNADGEPATGRGEQFYSQVSPASQADDKVVYTVAGSSGKLSLGKGKLDHPAHAMQPRDPQLRHGLAQLGSVVIDVGRSVLTARFINDQGEVLDSVSIRR
ncbi:hypothetical protein G8764_14405 [Pseudomaricurvus alcaniphilus]|uniref:metallophosphoesterase family protein n=1 Tax=Pseudomaricurvus alcaniphilus TaxID=1166482 RepID=UPI00140B41FC|nr:metallophosphoesterase [Pseudomaricurvus alcaniphilus]NHN38496.1 hypothetical protein [Pseudomaricurvus alcaniphilus]